MDRHRRAGAVLGQPAPHRVGAPLRERKARLEKLLASRNMTLLVTPGAKAWLAESGYDPVYGARPVKRAIQRDVQDPLAMKLLSGEFHEGDTVVVNVDNGRLAFHKNEPVKQAA